MTPTKEQIEVAIRSGYRRSIEEHGEPKVDHIRDAVMALLEPKPAITSPAG